MLLTIDKGSKLGIHTLQSGGEALKWAAECKRRGLRMPLIKAVDNGGIAIDAKKLDPSILTITRKVNTQEDGCQFISDGNVDIASLMYHAKLAVDFPVYGRGNIKGLGKEELDAADWLEVLNEADPPFVVGWHNFGLYLCEVVKYASAIGVPIAIPGTNLGTPEWPEMQALVNTGLFKLIKDSWSDPHLKHGHIWTAHEGVLPGSNNPLGMGSIPGSPIVPGAGPTVWRYRFLYKLLADRNEIVPLVISEYYGSQGYNPANVNAIVASLSEYDREIRKDNYVLAALPFTMAGAAGSWGDQDYTPMYPRIIDYMDSVKESQNGTDSTPAPIPVPITPPPASVNVCLVGVHGRAEGRLEAADLEAIRVSKVQAVKLMSTAAPEDVDKLRAIKPNMLIMVRLFIDLKNRSMNAHQFVQDTAHDVQMFYDKGVRLFEIHNEPNLKNEGFGSSWNSGNEFGAWFQTVYNLIKTKFPDIQLGFPGLSPGGEVAWDDQAGHTGYVRYNQERFLAEAIPYIPADAWIGLHAYFINDIDRTLNESGGLNYKVYQRLFPKRTLYITEFSNPVSGSATEMGEQYVKYYATLRTLSNVGAAFCFIVSGHDWEREAWRLENGQLTTIPGIIGAYMDKPAPIVVPPVVIPPVPVPVPVPVNNLMTHSVTAAVLNVRQFPWLSTAVPPVTGQLKYKALVRSHGVIKLPGMQYGWHLISPLGNQWVSGGYLKPVV